jgi:hypothetical protein
LAEIARVRLKPPKIGQPERKTALAAVAEVMTHRRA